MPVPTLPRFRHTLSPDLRLALFAACMAAAVVIVTFGRPAIENVAVTYPDNPDLQPQDADLPFQGEAVGKAVTFTVDATVRLTPASSPILRVAPDECLEEFAVNGGKPHDLRQDGEETRCWPHKYRLTALGELGVGENTLRMTLTNEQGPHGIDIRGSLTTAAALAASCFAWAALAAASWPILARSGKAGRHLRRFALVSYGVVLTAGLRLNAGATVSPLDAPFVALAASTVAAWLLMAALDGQRRLPLPERVSRGWVLASLLGFTLAALKSASPYEPVARFVLILCGVSAGVFAVMPFFATLHRARKAPAAVAVALLAAAMPLAYDQGRLLLWQALVVPTTEAVAGVAAAIGWKASTAYGTKLWENGTAQDYHGYVTTPEFSVQIGAQCGGFEGMALFLFLLSGFILLDWRFFSRTNKLWLPFVATIPYLFLVNVLRIAAILVYALLIRGEVDQDAARQAAVETFHSNAGWVVYSLAFGPYLLAVYWWARRKIRIPAMQ
ncbi:: Exosortase_EpsH [Gemmataceae bacterium]|jgi:exosortase/archaeosortase family protein|nr:: Exosortase_EpsH [Gemmataceae bacterium]VTU01639.1 : Exosortase_EpsH [Gemmataceae bacterium]